MDLTDRLSLLTSLDFIALAALVIGFFAIGWRIEYAPAARPSVSKIMAEYRRLWFRETITRQPRIFDASILSSLRQGTSFFASTCFLSLGGVMALMGNTEELSSVITEFDIDAAPTVIWQSKLIVVAGFLAYGFLKFVWSNRLFGYCAVVMAAIPNEIDDPLAQPRANQAAELNVRAAINFNRGLRALYFALAALAWFLGATALILATLLTVWILWAREFRSWPRKILLQTPPAKP